MSAERRIRVAVLSGGRSSEHEISLASAASVQAALDPERYDVLPITIARTGAWQLPAAQTAALLPGAARPIAPALREPGAVGASLDIDVVLPILHGPFGEDGTVQGLCELLGVPYVGAGVLGSALAMDKAICKSVLRDAGIRVARSATLRAGADDPDAPALAADLGERFGYPLFVKPARLGSSVGISKVHDAGELPVALADAFRHDDKILVEELLSGRELECGVLGNDAPVASAVAEIRPCGEWYDYEAKYAVGGSDIVIPAELTAETAERVKETSLAAFRACECAGMARIDFFLLDDGALVVNELNTIPGFTETSVYARLFAAVGISYSRLLDRLVELALERHAQRAKLAY